MNKLICVLLIIFAFISCNGGKTKNDTLKESVEKFKDTLGTLEIEEYIPKEYTEINSDTILSNGFNVKIKTFTDMNHSVVNEFKQDSIIFKHHYREFNAQIRIYKEDKKVINFLVNKNFIIQNDPSYNLNKEFYDKIIIQNIWLSEYNSTLNDKIVLIVELCIPETDNCLAFKIDVDKSGNYEVKEFEYDEIL
ncbi:hypothetical protein VP395_09670 [Mariniflexile soesokkakense]|uniref:Uncharacterized protein n=1 Tax=Mariniflexile soesokkakense TaxID=1343160 RepID=A0ABV0ADL9_9FLAO